MKTFKSYFFEGLIKIPTNEIISWVDRNFTELQSKINETNTKGYDTYIEENIKVLNPYNKEITDISVEIRKKLQSTSEKNVVILFYNEQSTIYLNASIIAQKQNLKEYLIQSFIHEISHKMDPGYSYKNKDSNTYSEYINSDVEFPVHVNEFIAKINLLSNKPEVLKNIMSGTKTGIKDLDDFYSELNSKNKKKFLNLIYKEFYGQSGNSDNTEL